MYSWYMNRKCSYLKIPLPLKAAVFQLSENFHFLNPISIFIHFIIMLGAVFPNDDDGGLR